MSFAPTKVRPSQTESADFEEITAAAEADALAEAPELNIVAAVSDAVSEAASNETIQYNSRRERREAERAAAAQARVEAFSESLRAAKAVAVAPAVPAVGETDEVEIPESFRAEWASSRTRTSRMFGGRRVPGSTVALGLMAGTVVIGTGSAAAFAATGTTEAANLTANVTEETAAAAAPVVPEVEAEEVAVTDAQAAAATLPAIEATSVTSFDSATVAGLAVKEEVVEEKVEEPTTAASAESAASSASTSTAQAGIVWPVGNSSISSYFGYRDSPTSGASSNHQGVDFTPGYGAAVGSMASGTVVATDFGSTSYGLYIDVEHTINGQTITTRYAHLSAINVSVGQSVSAGETIGNVGSTGVSTGAHLHFEVHVNGAPTDPLAYLQSNA